MKITLGPNESKPVTVAGGQFYLLSAFSKVAVKIVSGGDSRVFELSSGMGFKAREGERFFGVEIRDLGGVGQTIEFEISDREVFDNRVRGVTEVINSDKARTELGQAFIMAPAFVADAAKCSNVALYNPDGSGMNLYVERILMSSTQPGECLVISSRNFLSDAALPNVTSLNPAAFTPGNKRVESGFTSGAGLGASFFTNGLVAGGTTKRLIRVNVLANTVYEYKFIEPIMLVEGSGIIIANSMVNAQIGGTIEFFEELKA